MSSQQQSRKAQLVIQAELQRVAFKMIQDAVEHDIRKLGSISFLMGSSWRGIKSAFHFRQTTLPSLLVMGGTLWSRKTRWGKELRSVQVGYYSAKRIVRSALSWVKDLRR